jgi:hypothetical protein
MLTYLAVGDILEGVKILILGGNFNTTSPTAGTIEVQAAGIRNCSPVNPELVVVETFILRARVTGPDSTFVLGQIVFHGADIQLNSCRFRC